MDFSKINKVYCLGIGGSGVSALAQIFHLQGKQVSGSDLNVNVIIKKLIKNGIKVDLGQSAEDLPQDADLYIYSDAVPETNAQRQMLKKLNLEEKSLSYFSAVGELMKEYTYSIAVSGTHGKTTTTGMLAVVLEAAGLDPTVIVGSEIKQFGSNARLGQDKKYFIVEACEHQEHMLKLNPKAIILTNIEEDHLDYYRDLEQIVIAFQNYINKLPKDGVLVKNEDDSESRDLGFDGKIITYGIDKKAQVSAKKIKVEGQNQSFNIGNLNFQLKIPGRFNIYNALAVYTFCSKQLGIKEEIIQKALAAFTGTGRRFEILGEYRGAKVISDYAHHPTAVAGVIKAAKEFYPEKRIFVVFQPHQRTRTQKLFKQFVSAFDQADFIILPEIYDVPGRESGAEKISSQDLVGEIEKRGKYVFFAPNFEKVEQLIHEHLERGDLLLILGAGDIYRLAEKLVKHE